MQTVTYIQGGRFGGLDDDDPHYKCCYGIIHVRNGAMIIAIVEIIFSILVALGGITGVTSGKYKSSSESGSYFNCGITIIVSLLMIYGLWKTSRYFLIPHMVFQIIFIIICGLLAVVFIILTIGFNAITSNREEYVEHRGKGVVFLITMAIVFAIAAALQIWFFTVVLCAFRYLRDEQAVTSRGNPIFHYSSRNM